MLCEQRVELRGALAQGNVSLSGDFRHIQTQNCWFLAPSITGRSFRQPYEPCYFCRSTPYFHHKISTWIQMTQELPQCLGDSLGVSEWVITSRFPNCHGRVLSYRI